MGETFPGEKPHPPKPTQCIIKPRWLQYTCNASSYKSASPQLELGETPSSTSLANWTQLHKHLPKPSFYSDFTTWKPLVVLQNHGQNYHATCYPFLTFTFPIWENNQVKIVIPSTILSLSLDPHKSHKMSHQGSKNDLSIFYYGQDSFLTTH